MKFSRRTFIKASTAYAGINFLPSHVWANSPNSKLSVVQIGIGGKGKTDIKSLITHPSIHTAAICDVDQLILKKQSKPYPDAKQFTDYREMFSDLNDRFDAVVVSTPDHSHFPQTMDAIKRGKHIYCQKPLAHEVDESMKMARAASKAGVTTQMGIQGHSSIGNRMSVDLIQQGVIGKISKVYTWSYKSWGDDAPPYNGADPVPESLDWNLWLGSAPKRSFLLKKYHTNNWRRIIDFGCGTLGDMGVHIFDMPYTALELTAPISVKTTCREPNGNSHPADNIVEYIFPGTKYTSDKLAFTWFDGKNAPIHGSTNPDLQLPDGQGLPKQGALLVGEDGKRLMMEHNSGPQVYPRSALSNAIKPSLPALDHYHQWVDACLGKGSCSANFKYAANMTSGVLLGVIANRFPGQTLNWNGKHFTNNSDANKLLTRSYREY